MDNTVSNERVHTINHVQKTVGYYRLNNFYFAQPKKPNLWHKFFMRVLLNFHWEDAE